MLPLGQPRRPAGRVRRRRIDELEASPHPADWSLLREADPRAAHALVPEDEIDPVFARLLDIAAPAATCQPDRPLTGLPASLPGFYADQLTCRTAPC
ncbi:hypothetical protein [Streptomyces soliscabiei]|uniref:hypothetical protein n=1 Tax=Streptomyces soliscabiei TaxID=588897 RepID=UPI0029BF22CE|nr:hypothetical protein [Streptomyces sp. NY05-11A]MDX2677966.1 hypothetical protein [Streptomyces sp. NY05-11A]